MNPKTIENTEEKESRTNFESAHDKTGPGHDEAETAYQVHTLIQMLHWHLATTQLWRTQSWGVPQYPNASYDPMPFDVASQLPGWSHSWVPTPTNFPV